MRQGDKVDPNLRLAAVLLYVLGKSTSQVGWECDVSHVTVAKWVREAGVPVRPAGTPAPDADIEAVVAAYVSGEGCVAVACRFEVSPGWVLAQARKAGVEIRPAGNQRRAVLEVVVE